jgi:hypothetical protein
MTMVRMVMTETPHHRHRHSTTTPASTTSITSHSYHRHPSLSPPPPPPPPPPPSPPGSRGPGDSRGLSPRDRYRGPLYPPTPTTPACPDSSSCPSWKHRQTSATSPAARFLSLSSLSSARLPLRSLSTVLLFFLFPLLSSFPSPAL